MPIDRVQLPNGDTEEVRDSRISGVDSAPTSGSANLVTSGGVKSALDGYLPKGGLSTADGAIASWGTLTSANGYSPLLHWASSDGGDLTVANKSGQISMQLDGLYYQNEGQYRVLDTSDIGSIVASQSALSGYLPLTGGTMSGTITYPGRSYEIIRTGGDDTTWRGGLRYSWSSNTTIALWGKNNMSQFVWHAGTDFSENDVNGTVTRNYDFQVGRTGTGSLEALVGGNTVWHDGNAVTQVSSWDSTVNSVFKSSESGAGGAPTSDYCYGLHMRFHRGSDGYFTDLATSLYSDNLYYRRHTEAGYQNWKRLAFSDELSGYLPLSGGTMTNTNLVTNLNADLLDGRQGSDYVWREKHGYNDGTIPSVLGTGFHEIVVQNVEYSSILAGRDEIGKEWQLYFHPHEAYSDEVYYLKPSKNLKRQFAFTDSNVASATNADTVDGKHANDFAYEWTAYAGGTHVGWEKIVEFPLNSEDQFGSTNLILTLGRQYASPAPESYTILISIGWCSATLQVLNSNVNTQIMERFRVALDSTNHKLYFEYYVNTDWTTYANPVKCKMYGDNKISDTVALMGEPDASPDSLSEVAAIYLPRGNARIYGDFGAVTGTGISPIWSDRWDSGGRYRPWYGLDIPTDGNGVALSGYYGIRFRTAQGDVRIDTNGNVGIGTATPTHTLHVSGDAVVTGGFKGETMFIQSSYTDPAVGVSCAIKASGNVAVGGDIIASGSGNIKGESVTTTLQTSEPSGGMLPNREYQLGTLSGNTTFTLASGTSGVTNHYFWSFDTGSTAPTITWPSGITSWYGGSAPTINASKHYEVSVLNGVAVVMEV